MRQCESEMTNGLTLLLFCDVHIDMGNERDTELPVCYLWM